MILPIAIFSLLLHGCTRQESPSYTGPPTKMTIGIFKAELSTVLLVADKSGYFKQMGLDVELREFGSGVEAMTALNAGLVDMAVPAEFVFVSNIDKNPDLRIVASINRVKNVYMVGRKDRGINKPSDLKGKRIAVTRTSIGEYFLVKYLNSTRLKQDDVSIINLTPANMEKEIAVGSIDAAIVWNPIARLLIESLGANAVSWPAQSETLWNLVLVARDSLIKKEPAAMVRLMKALIMAEKSIEKDPAATQQNLSKQLGVSEKYLADVWGENQFRVSLDRSLMLMLEEETSWIQKNQGTAQKLPNYLNYIYLDSLKAARPESVSIIH
jgi:NitT/TauT family transport system substrate-binding protein